MSGWSGEDPLNNAMGKVASRNPPSQSSVKSFVKICLSYSKEYKHIVHYVEKFMKECDDEELLPMCYAIDAILRQFMKTSKENGKKLCSRFQTNLIKTMTNFSKANKKDKKSIKKVVSRWGDKGFFDSMIMEDAMEAADLGSDNDGRSNQRQNEQQQQKPPNASDVLDLLSSATGNNNNIQPPHGQNYNTNNNNNFQQMPPFQHRGGPPAMFGRGMAPNMGMPPRGMPPRGMPPRGMPPQMHQQYGQQQQFRGPPTQHFPPPTGNNSLQPRGYTANQMHQQRQIPRGPQQQQQQNKPPQGKKPEEGEICHGFINNIKDFGCFVQLDRAHDGYFGLVPKAKISNQYVSDVHAAVQRNQQVYVKVMQVKQNLQNGRTDYSFSMRDVNQETGEPQSDAPATQPRQQQQQYQNQQQYQPPQHSTSLGRPTPVPTGYSGSKTNQIPLGKKRDFGQISSTTYGNNGNSVTNNNSSTGSMYQTYQQPPQPPVGMNRSKGSNNVPVPFKAAPAPFKTAPAPFKAAPAPFKAAPAPFKAAPAPFKAAPAPPAGLFKTAPAPPAGLFKSAVPPPFKKVKQ